MTVSTVISSDDWVERGLAKCNRRVGLRPYVMRLLRHSDLDALHTLHDLVIARVPHPDVFRPDSVSYMAQLIRSRGRTVGILCEGALVAYAAISFPGDAPENLGRDVPLPDTELLNVAHYDGSAVHPDYRGNRFQKLMTEMRHRYALTQGYHHILGTVSPLNPVSLANFLDIGCRVKNVKIKYGGMVRLIIHIDLRDGVHPTFDPRYTLDVSLGEAEVQACLLNEGFEGFAVVPGESGPCLRVGLPEYVAASRLGVAPVIG